MVASRHYPEVPILHFGRNDRCGGCGGAAMFRELCRRGASAVIGAPMGSDDVCAATQHGSIAHGDGDERNELRCKSVRLEQLAAAPDARSAKFG